MEFQLNGIPTVVSEGKDRAPSEYMRSRCQTPLVFSLVGTKNLTQLLLYTKAGSIFGFTFRLLLLGSASISSVELFFLIITVLGECQGGTISWSELTAREALTLASTARRKNYPPKQTGDAGNKTRQTKKTKCTKIMH